LADTVEHSVRKFYDEYGWSKGGEDDLFRRFRPAYRRYHEQTVARTLACFSECTGALLIVGGGDLPRSHVMLAERFEAVTCIDISKVALAITQQKIPAAKTVLGSICTAPFAADTYDAVFAAHVIYHIDAEQQETAVRELIRIAKCGGRVVILYNNPRSPIRFLAGAVHRLRKLLAPEHAVGEAGLYFSPYPLEWWNRFKESCEVSMLPWDIIGSYAERNLIPSDRVASIFYRTAAWVERMLPRAAVHLWQYPIVILDKKRG
jgi:SAM-dependent methyltransferase